MVALYLTPELRHAVATISRDNSGRHTQTAIGGQLATKLRLAFDEMLDDLVVVEDEGGIEPDMLVLEPTLRSATVHHGEYASSPFSVDVGLSLVARTASGTLLTSLLASAQRYSTPPPPGPIDVAVLLAAFSIDVPVAVAQNILFLGHEPIPSIIDNVLTPQASAAEVSAALDEVVDDLRRDLESAGRLRAIRQYLRAWSRDPRSNRARVSELVAKVVPPTEGAIVDIQGPFTKDDGLEVTGASILRVAREELGRQPGIETLDRDIGEKTLRELGIESLLGASPDQIRQFGRWASTDYVLVAEIARFDDVQVRVVLTTFDTRTGMERLSSGATWLDSDTAGLTPDP